jgi:hypothetical protein
MVLADVRKAQLGKFEISYKTFIDFLTRKRVNVAFQDKGFVDPLIAQCCKQITKAKDAFSMSYEQLFDLFNGNSKKLMGKETFLICM